MTPTWNERKGDRGLCLCCLHYPIKNALKEVVGVTVESVNPVTAQAVIDYDPSLETLDKMR
ncbi:MAG: hypothetical protein ACXV3E_07685 [Halobacteriota archaeon]